MSNSLDKVKRCNMKIRKKILLVIPLFVFISALFFSGCESSRIASTWNDPQYKTGPMKDVLVLSVLKNKTQRRLWEDAFVQVLEKKGMKATPSYRLYPNDVPDEKDIPNLFKDDFDGVILVQKVNEQNRKYFVPGYYGFGWPFHRRYGWMYGSMWDAGYIENERIVQFETSVWEPRQDGNMVFSVVTETRNPTSFRELRDDIMKLVIPKLSGGGIIPGGKQTLEM
jgi:hypothetical protein